MSTDTDSDQLVSDLTNHTYNAVAHILRHMARLYLEKLNDTLLVNDALVHVMSQMVGEMIACYPENEQEELQDRVFEFIKLSKTAMTAELAEASFKKVHSDKNDLATMKPRGNC